MSHWNTFERRTLFFCILLGPAGVNGRVSDATIWQVAPSSDARFWLNLSCLALPLLTKSKHPNTSTFHLSCFISPGPLPTTLLHVQFTVGDFSPYLCSPFCFCFFATYFLLINLNGIFLHVSSFQDEKCSYQSGLTSHLVDQWFLDGSLLVCLSFKEVDHINRESEEFKFEKRVE